MNDLEKSLLLSFTPYFERKRGPLRKERIRFIAGSKNSFLMGCIVQGDLRWASFTVGEGNFDVFGAGNCFLRGGFQGGTKLFMVIV